MIYFAYASNLDYQQMMARCPSALLLGSARLDGYRLCFPRRSFVRQSAVASIEPAHGASVWGAIYEILDREVDRLDAREGYFPRKREGQNISNRVFVTVRQPDSPPIEAITYIANPVPDPGLPTADYMSIIVTGAIAFRAPDEYVSMLRAQPTGMSA